MADSKRDKLVAYFMSEPDLLSLPDTAFVQAKWRASLRLESLRLYPPMTVEEGARLLLISADQVLSRWDRWATERRVFSVIHQGERLYPAFQFDPSTGEPGEVVSELLSIFGSEDTRDAWSIYLWLTHRRPSLGERVPAEVLSHEPDAVLIAARAVADPVEG